MGAVSIAQASFMALDRIMEAKGRSRSGAANPTRAHVHPKSRMAGTFEDEWFYSYANGEPDRLYRRACELLKGKNAIRRLARAEGRELTDDEKIATLITGASLRVFEQLVHLARLCGGKVFPTWQWIERNAGVSRASVGRALDCLSTMGLIQKERRCLAIEPPADRPKARNAQTSNVYRMSFPNRLVRFLPQRFRPVALPEDVVQAEADRIEEIAAMRAWRSPRQIAEEDFVDFADIGMRRVMIDLAQGIERQESQKIGQPLIDSYIHRDVELA